MVRILHQMGVTSTNRLFTDCSELNLSCICHLFHYLSFQPVTPHTIYPWSIRSLSGSCKTPAGHIAPLTFTTTTPLKSPVVKSRTRPADLSAPSVRLYTSLQQLFALSRCFMPWERDFIHRFQHSDR